MYEGLANLLELKGMGMTEDSAGFQRAFRLSDMIPIVAAQAMPKQGDVAFAISAAKFRGYTTTAAGWVDFH